MIGGAQGLGDLDGVAAEATSRGHEQSAGLADVTDLGQHERRGQADGQQAGGDIRMQALRGGDYVGLLGDGELCVTAVGVVADDAEHALPTGGPSTPAPSATTVPATSMPGVNGNGVGWSTGPATADHVREVDGGGLDLDQDLAGGGCAGSAISVSWRTSGPPDLGHLDGLHQLLRGSRSPGLRATGFSSVSAVQLRCARCERLSPRSCD